MSFHSEAEGDSIHVLNANTYTDIAARDADTDFQVTANVNKMVRVNSPVGYFLLVSLSPTVWTEAGSEGLNEFTELIDTPASYAGQAGRIILVSAGETALEFGQVLTSDGSPTFIDLTLLGKLIAENIGIGLNDPDSLLEIRLPPVNGDGGIKLSHIGADRLTVGYATVGIPIDNVAQAQITVDLAGNLRFSSRTNNASDLIFYTNAGTAAIERLRINDLGQLSVGVINADVSAIFDLFSTTRGFLPPRMATTQRDAIASPATGLIIYNTTTDDVENFNGVSWVGMGGGDVNGPASSTDKAIARFNGTSGENIQDSLAIISDVGDLTLPGSLSSVAANFISVRDTTIQSVAVADTYQTVTFDTNNLIDGWTHTPGSDAMTCPEDGVYELSVFAHVMKTGGIAALAQFRVTVNGAPTGDVLTTDIVSNNETILLAASNLVSLINGDVLRLEFTANSTSVEFTTTTITGPGVVSSAVFTVTRVK